MNKSVLVINTPSRCYDCQFNECKRREYTNKYESVCTQTIDANNYEAIFRRIEEPENARPTWCPLRPLPEHKDLKKYVAFKQIVTLNDQINYAYSQGYNDCLNEITKGETNV